MATSEDFNKMTDNGFSRRSFLKLSATTVGAAAALGVVGCSQGAASSAASGSGSASAASASASASSAAKKEISFKDISPLLANPDAFRSAIKEMADYVKEWKADVIIGPESRGFIFGCPVALEANGAFSQTFAVTVPTQARLKVGNSSDASTYPFTTGVAL